ncbi:hypothetical protein D1007_60516 [Hordeum vulgare]|nr:hypothetical protein D1007_60516 [Hordeum vulgare]
MEITTHTDPEVDVQGFDALSVNTTPATGVVDHSVSFLVPGDPAALTLTRCSTKYSCRDTNRLRYALHPATTPSCLVLQPKPWPSFWRDHAEETNLRPLPWPSFSVGRFLEHPYLIVQLHGIGLNTSSIPKKHFHIGDTCEWRYILIGHYIRIFSGLFLCLWSLKQDNVDSEFSKHVKLFHVSHWLAGSCPASVLSWYSGYASVSECVEIGCSEHRTLQQYWSSAKAV